MRLFKVRELQFEPLIRSNILSNETLQEDIWLEAVDKIDLLLTAYAYNKCEQGTVYTNTYTGMIPEKCISEKEIKNCCRKCTLFPDDLVISIFSWNNILCMGSRSGYSEKW